MLLYQGEELGLPEVDLRRDQLKDPVGDLYYPAVQRPRRLPHADALGRRRAESRVQLGHAWLPLGPTHRALAVSEQENDAASPLNFARRFLIARKRSAALRLGDIEFLDAPAPVLAFIRAHEGERVLCVFNLSRDNAEFRSDLLPGAKVLDLGCGEATLTGASLSLGPLAAWFAGL